MKRLIALLSIFFSITHGIYPQQHNIKKIRILTLNTALLPKQFGLVTIGMGNNQNRAKMIADTINSMHNTIDIICLQEAFDTKALKFIRDRIKKNFPYSHIDTRSGGFFKVIGVNSGLGIISKFPIKKKLLNDYTCFTGEESVARKGLLGVKLDIGPGGRTFLNISSSSRGSGATSFYVFTTHMQAGGGSKFFKFTEKLRKKDCLGQQPKTTADIRRIEMMQARNWIRKFVDEKNAPQVLTGDFNINHLEQEYQNIQKVFTGSKDIAVESIVAGTSWEKDPKTGKRIGQAGKKRIDFIILLNPSSPLINVENAQSQITTRFTHKMTDHLGVIGTIPVNV